MSRNVHDLFSGKKKRDDKDDDSDDDENNRFVGGISDRGGGSGLAVQPNPDDMEGHDRDRVFTLAENATAEDSGRVRRTITMYRDGFTVDDGPYRRLDDPANAEFLRALAMGRTPRELTEEAAVAAAAGAGETASGGNVLVGLLDKRNEDYVEEFRSFSGQGTSLGTATATASVGGVFDPSTLPETPPAVVVDDDSQPTTSIAVRLLNGQRRVIRIQLTQTVLDLATHLRNDVGGGAFRMTAGFPPKPLMDPNATIQDAGLKGAQVSLQKA